MVGTIKVIAVAILMANNCVASHGTEYTFAKTGILSADTGMLLHMFNAKPELTDVSICPRCRGNLVCGQSGIIYNTFATRNICEPIV